MSFCAQLWDMCVALVNFNDKSTRDILQANYPSDTGSVEQVGTMKSGSERDFSRFPVLGHSSAQA